MGYMALHIARDRGGVLMVFNYCWDLCCEKLARMCIFGRGYAKFSLFLDSDWPQMGALFCSGELLGFFQRTSDLPLEALNVFV